MRKLASIQRVDKIEPIEGADRIEKLTVNAWSVVSQKGNFQVGDLGVFFEIDAIPPDIDFYKDLWTTKDNPEGIRPPKFRITTKRLRGVLSQGYIVPLDKVLTAHGLSFAAPAVGTDMTDVLNVGKYEAPVPMNGDQDGPWVWSDVPKTDELRVQSFPGVLDELRGKPYIITEKCDGTSMSFGFDDDGEFRVCGRNWSIKEGDNAYWSIFRDNTLISELWCGYSGLVFQGELYGPGILKNPLELPKPTWFGFSIYWKSQHRYLTHYEMTDVWETSGLRHVRIMKGGEDFQYNLDDLLEMAKGTYDYTRNPREGIVVRPRDEEIYSPTLGGRLSFKVINNDYLLKVKD